MLNNNESACTYEKNRFILKEFSRFFEEDKIVSFGPKNSKSAVNFTSPSPFVGMRGRLIIISSQVLRRSKEIALRFICCTLLSLFSIRNSPQLLVFGAILQFRFVSFQLDKSMSMRIISF